MILCPLENTALALAGGWGQKRPTITQIFGSRPNVYKQFGLDGHNGLDLRAIEGVPVFAGFEGKVQVKNDGEAGYGLHVKLRSSYRAKEMVYGHLSKVFIKDTEEVHMGDLIGQTGNTGFSTAPHLHTGLRFIVPRSGDVFGWEVLDYDNGYKGWVDPSQFMINWKGTFQDSSLSL